MQRTGRSMRGIRRFMGEEGGRDFCRVLMEDWGFKQMHQRFKVILTLLVLAAMLVIFLFIPMFLLRR